MGLLSEKKNERKAPTRAGGMHGGISPDIAHALAIDNPMSDIRADDSPSCRLYLDLRLNKFSFSPQA